MTRPRGLTAITAALLAAGVAMSAPAAATATHDASTAHHSQSSHHAAKVRHYDKSLLSHTNSARSDHHRKHYSMNTRLWKIAHAYAEHLSKTGDLVHNPKLEQQVSKACPKWTDIGENIGESSSSSADTLFQAYMHSPPHRANLLDDSYTQVGIASVTVMTNGTATTWNVIDFGNHCPK